MPSLMATQESANETRALWTQMPLIMSTDKLAQITVILVVIGVRAIVYPVQVSFSCNHQEIRVRHLVPVATTKVQTYVNHVMSLEPHV